jgi:uncharacterized membrane protein YgcG
MSVKSLLSFPDILQRMVENPRWTSELGEAFLTQEAHVLDTVQALRRRAQQQGTLKSDERQVVTQEGAAIVVQPRTEVVYAPYYDPLVVYGGWWWPAYYPVYWRPWVVAPVVVAAGFWYARPVWHHRHVVVHKHGHHHGHGHVHHGAVHSKPYHSVQEGFRKPIVSSTPQMHRFDEHRGRGGDERRGWNRGGERRNHAMPAAPRFSEPRPQGRPPAQQTQQPRVHAPQRQPRAQAPQQQPRAHTPQHQPRAHVPQHQPRASAPQQPPFGAQQQGGGHRSGGGGGGGHRSNGGGGRSGRG